MDYIFKNTLLPEWTLGLIVTLAFMSDGSISIMFGGGMLTLIGGMVFLIYKNEVPSVRLPSILVLLAGVILLLTSLF